MACFLKNLLLRELAEYLAGISIKPTLRKKRLYCPPLLPIFNDDENLYIKETNIIEFVLLKTKTIFVIFFKLHHFCFWKTGGTQFYIQYSGFDAQFQNIILYEKNTGLEVLSGQFVSKMTRWLNIE